MQITKQTAKIARICGSGERTALSGVLFKDGTQVASNGKALAVYRPAQSVINPVEGNIPAEIFDKLQFKKDRVVTLEKCSDGAVVVRMHPETMEIR